MVNATPSRSPPVVRRGELEPVYGGPRYEFPTAIYVVALALATLALSANADTLVATFSYSQGDFEFTTIEGGGEKKYKKELDF